MDLLVSMAVVAFLLASLAAARALRRLHAEE
jgi:hypothetical protein